MFLTTWTSGGNARQLIYPLVTGFALLGPFAALGFYEIGRLREQHLDTSWKHGFEVRRSPAMPAIAVLVSWLVALFVAWLFTAQAPFAWLHGDTAPANYTAFITTC